ncbi:short-chain dehydrogenase/reductase [Gordonia sp. SID5947]|uniref:short-chain dehydrogenase/reductase n=1 Tax=Gordonia sp. SID5947 TaxID=2690315 RepID=UPI001F01C9F0|nr:short-chain dehydrogenase/reductase [Gordonia sp. SID5947]
MRLDVTGRVVVVTGAGKGIGFAVAEQLQHRGARLALIDVDRDQVEAAARRLGDTTFACTADVRDRAAMRDAMTAVIAHFGSIDVVVANAGVTPPPATVRAMEDADFDRVIGVNLFGVYNTVRPALDQIIANKGHVVIVSSGAAFSPGAGGSPYMISKSAVGQLGRALRLELAPHGATSGTVHFGIVDTDMTHEMLDADELGQEIGAMLPWPLRRRISAETAAETIVDNVTSRAADSFAPFGWRQLKWVHGMLNPVMDRFLARSATMQRLILSVDDPRHR